MPVALVLAADLCRSPCPASFLQQGKVWWGSSGPYAAEFLKSLRMKIRSLCGYVSQCSMAFCESSLFPCSARPCLPAAGHHWLLSCYLCPKFRLYNPCLGSEGLLWDASFAFFSPSLTNPGPSFFPPVSFAANRGALWAVPPSGAARWVFSPCCCKDADLFIFAAHHNPQDLPCRAMTLPVASPACP